VNPDAKVELQLVGYGAIGSNQLGEWQSTLDHGFGLQITIDL
jgi:hypothetical protein